MVVLATISLATRAYLWKEEEKKVKFTAQDNKEMSAAISWA